MFITEDDYKVVIGDSFMEVESLGSWEVIVSSTVAQSVTSLVSGPI